MLTEKTRNKALEDFLKGRKVVVMTVFDDGSIAAEKLEDILMTEDVHFLVDVPAVEDMEFKQAVADMVQPAKKQGEPSGEKSVTPPLRAAGGERGASGRKNEKGDCPAACRTGDEGAGHRQEDRSKVQYGVQLAESGKVQTEEKGSRGPCRL